MALIDRLPAREAAEAAAHALETVLGHDVMLALGEPMFGVMSAEMIPGGGTRCVALPFGNGIVGEVTLVVADRFAMSLQATAADAQLLTATLPALQRAADAIEPTIHLQAVVDHAGEIETDTLLTSVIGDFSSVPILENDEHVASIIVRILDDEPYAQAPAAAPVTVAPAQPSITLPTDAPAPPAQLPVAATAPTASAQPASASMPVAFDEPAATGQVVLHQFNPLTGSAALLPSPRPLTLLNDVHLEIIAELGRRPMKVRDLVSLEPGSVVELDRAAGSPVDLLVNGSLLAHGEVVVIDEEFGIRISEIIVGDS